MAYTSVGQFPPNPAQVFQAVKDSIIPPQTLAPGAAAGITDQQLAILAVTSPGAAAALAAKRAYDRSAQSAGATQQGASMAQVAAAQGYLTQLGLYAGPVNGSMDAATQYALDTFRKAVSIPVGGGVTDADLKALKATVDAMKSGGGAGAGGGAGGGMSFGGQKSVLDSIPGGALGLAALAVLGIVLLRRA